ncbi:hypothetical protein CF065_18660 [Clostridium sporogenes]
MKKILSILIIGILSIGLVACGSTQTNNEKNKENDKPKQEEAKKESIKMPDKEMGKGKIGLSTPGGTSEGDKAPVLMVSKDDQIVQVGLNTEEFDGSKLSYIFVNGEEVAKEQLSETQTSIDLKGNALKAGKHKVEVVQFDNDKKDGKIITYKTASYECKEK